MLSQDLDHQASMLRQLGAGTSPVTLNPRVIRALADAAADHAEQARALEGSYLPPPAFRASGAPLPPGIVALDDVRARRAGAA